MVREVCHFVVNLEGPELEILQTCSLAKMQRY